MTPRVFDRYNSHDPSKYCSPVLRQKTAAFRQMEVIPMKQHRFWAWGAVFCMVMVMITGYKHK